MCNVTCNFVLRITSAEERAPSRYNSQGPEDVAEVFVFHDNIRCNKYNMKKTSSHLYIT
jgi:hypothetical protein